MEHKTLDRFPAGSRVRIESLCDCPKARCRLCAMGLTPGIEVEVLSSGSGPCDLRVRGSRIVLGHGLASRVVARLAEGNGDGSEGSEGLASAGSECEEKCGRGFFSALHKRRHHGRSAHHGHGGPARHKE